MPRKIKLQENSYALLKYLVERLPYGYATVVPLPSDVRDTGISMSTLRGLEKRGFARRSEHDIWYATEKGKEFIDANPI